jgi:hypothetical protein
MVPEIGVVLGVDVGWAAEKKTTGACVLEWTSNQVTVTPVHLATSELEGAKGLTSLTGRRPILAAAIDGPVRGTLDEIGVYRDAEMMLTRGLAERIGKPGQSSSGNGKKLNAAANQIARLVVNAGQLGLAGHSARIHERAIVEAFPTTFLGVMLDEGSVPNHGGRSDIYFQHLLGPNAGCPPVPTFDRLAGLIGRLLPNRQLASVHLGAVRHHEDRAATICALTALCVVARQYVAVGDRKNGYIVLPPRAAAGEPGLQPWAWRIIEGNRPTNAKDAIIVE